MRSGNQELVVTVFSNEVCKVYAVEILKKRKLRSRSSTFGNDEMKNINYIKSYKKFKGKLNLI